jgi:hypothetical protein
MRGAAGLALAALLGSPAISETSHVCSLDPEIVICALKPRLDADGILLPGLHITFDAPTDRYDHGVLGDAVEWGALTYILQGSPEHGPFLTTTYTLPESRVFEDTAPRVAEFVENGSPEIVVVETDVARGASLAIYALGEVDLVKIAATPFIGQKHRWLAPAGIADFDGDGRVEIAYVDRPHLLGELVFVRLEGKTLREVARLGGLSNHRIGDETITGGVRTCGKAPELVLVSKDFDRLMVVGYRQGRPESTDLGPFSQSALDAAMECRPLP